ncbi:hypothetical protein P9112_013725 [Eukaryota sp. TZLM1-RC]
MKPLPLKGSKKCSICGISGHNSRTCPEKQKREFELKSAQQILKCSVPAVAVVKGAENNVSDDQQLNASSVPSSSPSENSNFCCPFCKKDVADSRNGRKLLFCTNCKAVDTVRPPIRIPVEISPASTIPFSMEMRNFTSELKNNKWNISSFWKYFARKNKNCFKKKFGNRKIVKSKICRKLCLRGRKKIDKIERTEKMKPLPLKGSKKCSICGISGHNSRTCPEKQKREFELKSAQQILKCSVPAVAVVKGAENNVSDDQQLNASSVPSSSPSENSNFCCPFCKKDVADSRNGRKLLFCTNCKAVDTVRPPIRIPVEISPASTIPFSMEMRNFTSELKNNKWNISSFWKYFARKNKNCFKKKFGNRKIVKSKICRKLCLRGRKKIDKIERTEKMKPLPLKGSKKCSICGISGHNSRMCPEKQKREFELKSAQQILKYSVPAVAVVKGAENNVSDDQQLNASSVPSSSPSENSNFCCPFCKKRCCRFTKWSKTSVLPPIRIPVEISPASTIPFSMEMRNFTSELKNNKWNISSFWKYFARKNKNCFKKKFGNRKIVKSKICRKLCLRGRYGAAKQSLFSSSLADTNSDTLEKLQKLHPQENFKCSKPEVCPFWIENPITAIEVLKAIQKLPKGKAAGPSGISFDLLKIAFQCSRNC